jgi:2-polyprenyl-3-methyl-5-hydroxy-6-metoxy-1,4-benzoquinol methylase
MLNNSSKQKIKNKIYIFLGWLRIPNYFLPGKYRSGYSGLMLFKGRDLTTNDTHLSFVEPMPINSELTQYYKSLYWSGRQDRCSIRIRDVEHFYFVKKFLPENFSDKFVNFGAGHGGISNILDCNQKFDILDIDPSFENKTLHSKRRRLRTLSCVQTKVYFIYSSHSLEHVTNIDYFWKEVERLLLPGGFLFIEVPNSCNADNGGWGNGIVIPHTYYFMPEYFQNISHFKLVKMKLLSYKDEKSHDSNCKEAEVIRVLLKRVD